MSASHIDTQLPPEGEYFDASKLAFPRFLLLAVGGIGLVASIILFFTPLGPKFAYSRLFALYFFFSLAFWVLFWVLFHNATNSGWGISVRRGFANLVCMVRVESRFAISFVFPGMRVRL